MSWPSEDTVLLNLAVPVLSLTFWPFINAGFVLKKELAPTLENGRARVKVSEKEPFDIWEADSNFGEITYWNHDTLPSKADHIRSVMEWLPVSAAVSFLDIY